MDNASKQLYASPPPFCPFARFTNNEEEYQLIHFGESPILSNVADDKSSQSSSPHFRPLDWCNTIDGTYEAILCGVCMSPIIDTPFYSCKECLYIFSQRNVNGFHKECIEPVSKHPYHPKHSLRFIHYFELRPDNKLCFCLNNSASVYNCSLCDFTICQPCSRNPPLLAIDNPKKHMHTLFYFPRKGSMICDVCSFSDQSSLVYSCTQCDFLTHMNCVYFPCVIKISRHQHRLSFISSPTPGKWWCGVCRGKIDINYGRYSCVKGCNYGVHSKCATRKDVWDGKELEGTPEDEYEEDITKSFYEISDGIIQHFSHPDHHMRLNAETDRAFDENKYCQACTLPVCDGIIYNCMQCEFVLHQECAHLPRKKQHATHPHPLSLQVEHQDGWFTCEACDRRSNGFGYLCCERDCDYMLDMCCASIDEPFDHPHHPHPLYLTFDPETLQYCWICQKMGVMRLNCGESYSCGFVLCFGCATLPTKLRYKHDQHFLIFGYDKDASGKYVCDVCEQEADPKSGIYTCSDCNATLHIQCLLGLREDMYMMPRREEFIFREFNVTVLPNNHLSRNICKCCHNRCSNKVVYKISDTVKVCSLFCIYEWWHIKNYS
ncbi:uncharacterized protein LOC17892041 [Capsella rubella]|nr:uncharacterized protein LOC17892041 [Capsella rubella]